MFMEIQLQSGLSSIIIAAASHIIAQLDVYDYEAVFSFVE